MSHYGGAREGGAARAVLRPVVAMLLLAVSVAVTGCSGGPRSIAQTPPATSAASAAGAATVVMVIRHGEKPDGSPGVDAQGKPDKHSLTATGWERANRLVGRFDPGSGAPRPGLAVPKAIYAAAANDQAEGLRPRETVAPLAARLGLMVNTSYGEGDEQELVNEVANQPGPTLISWEHESIPAIARAFPSVTPTPPSHWPGRRFDVVWTFTRTGDGWHFAQVPELVLPEDQSSVISDTTK